MAYRILKKHKELGMNSLFAFETEPIDGQIYYREFNSKEEADEYVEEQLNMGVPKTSIEVVAYMKYTVSASIDEEECGCNVPSTNPPSANIPYEIVAKPVDGIVKRGTKIAFIIDANKTKFRKLLIDDLEVNKDYYSVAAGSTIVSLVQMFADTLELGEHTIKFIFSDGQAEDQFTIEESDVDTDNETNDAPIENDEDTV